MRTPDEQDPATVFRKILADHSTNAPILSQAGAIALESGYPDFAAQLLAQALLIDRTQPETHHHYAVALSRLNRREDAVSSYHEALNLNPDFPEALHDLANTLADLNRFDEAIRHYQQAVALRPNWPHALNNLGTVFLSAGDVDQAIASHQQALQLAPDDAQTHCRLADALAQKEDFTAAIAHYHRALELDPSNHETHNNLGNVYIEISQLDDALLHYRQAHQLRPDLPDIRSNLSKALLTLGQFEEGWREQESRWHLPSNPSGRPPADVWTGANPEGQTILLHTEQGFGDTIHFIRYASLLSAQGARVIVECQPELQPLLQQSNYIDQVILRGQSPRLFNLHAMLLSLPAIYNTTFETIPATVPYLHAPPDLHQHWKTRLSADSNFKVGLVWAGNPKQKNDRNRSTQLAQFAPLAAIPNISIYALQKGPAAEQLKSAPLKIIDCAPDLPDFAHTAALIENLDLVISVDTAVAHLAGALAKPVWTLLTFAADWRWLKERDDSPWYPTMRLFRQRTRGDWAEVIRRVADELRRIA